MIESTSYFILLQTDTVRNSEQQPNSTKKKQLQRSFCLTKRFINAVNCLFTERIFNKRFHVFFSSLPIRLGGCYAIFAILSVVILIVIAIFGVARSKPMSIHSSSSPERKHSQTYRQARASFRYNVFIIDGVINDCMFSYSIINFVPCFGHCFAGFICVIFIFSFRRSDGRKMNSMCVFVS